MSADERHRLARAYLLTASRLGDRDVTDLVWQYGPALAAELVAASTGGTWERDAEAAMQQCRKSDLRLIVPGDDEWPAALGKDPWTAPLGLWVRGGGHLHELVAWAVGIAGRTDATPYGVAVAAKLAGQVTRAGWTVVTLGRFGIDSAALRGALQDEPGSAMPEAAPKPTAAPPVVLPLGRLVQPEPPAHDGLFRRVGWNGVLAGEHGANVPARHGRPDARRQVALMAALSAAVVVIEPNGRGGDHRLIRAAEDNGRPVLAVPGPTTSAESRFAHELIRTGRARLVAGHSDVLAELEGSR